MNHGFIKLNREAEKLLETDPDSFLLMCQIAFRAKWKDNKLDMRTTQIGEALVGDFEKCGLTRKKYRCAIERLRNRKIVATKTTNKGTIAKVLDNCFCDLNLEIEGQQNGQQNGQSRATQGPSNGHPRATNKEVKKERIEETTPTPFDPDKAKALLFSFFKEQELTSEQQASQFKRGIPKLFAALQFISRPGFAITKTPMAAFVWACKEQPWLEEANQPKILSNRERVEQHFVDGEPYAKAVCAINSNGISFHRGIKSGGAKFEDKTFMATLSNVLEEFGIANPFKININIKEA